MRTYIPKPILTEDIELSDSLLKLTETLAKNAHETWAEQRIRDGWRYGPERDDFVKEHPDLVPYEQLDETEKEYDRLTAMATLKVILALGYKINPPSGQTAAE